ncbi:hypothetical protein Tco_1078321, partial [Tanacetum coccineum]
MVEADNVEDDEALQKKLWLMVAKNVVEQERGTKRQNIRKAIAFLKETDDLLKIEDILPFFLYFAEHILDLRKQLTLMSVEPKVGVNGGSGGADSITSMAPVDNVCLDVYKVKLGDLEAELIEINSNSEKLQRGYNELVEYKLVLQK